MPTPRWIDQDALTMLLRRHEQVLTHAQLVEAGVPLSTVCQRILRRGPWQRLHPGVVLTHTGTPTNRERLLGGLAYAGPDAVLTGLAALALHGCRVAVPGDEVHVLVPHARRRQSRPGLIAERTRAVPEAQQRRGLPVAPPARALVDACRTISRLDSIRGLVADVVQTGLCTVEELRVALAAAARQRSALPREVINEMAAGVRSAAEAWVRDVFTRHRIPQPRWNCALLTLDGEHVATPDGYWETIGGALQIDSMAFHLSPQDYKRTQRRARALGAYGIPVLPVAPGDVRADELQFVREVRAFHAANAQHSHPPELVMRPAAEVAERRPA